MKIGNKQIKFIYYQHKYLIQSKLQSNNIKKTNTTINSNISL